LQRARKFLSLVDVFGPFVLNVVPEVSVSRLDMVKLDDLYKLDSNGLNEEVRSIVRKLELAEAMQVRSRTVVLDVLARLLNPLWQGRPPRKWIASSRRSIGPLASLE
jgi:hypothetical protein